MGSKGMGACWFPNARRQVMLMRQTLSLFGHEVGNHVRRRGKSGSNVAQLKMLAAEVDAHVNVAWGRTPYFKNPIFKSFFFSQKKERKETAHRIFSRE